MQWLGGSDLNVGNQGTGQLTIQAGGDVTNVTAAIGASFGSTGAATVRGAGSTWGISSELHIGGGGPGTLTIEAGGSVSNQVASLGRTSTGAATVSGAGSTWTNGNTIFVGENAAGTLTIQDGGRVDGQGAVIGSDSGSSGVVTIVGAGSMWTTSDYLVVGDSGTGMLAITGGEVVAGGTLVANAQSRIQLAGGQLTVNVFGEGSLNALEWRSGTLRLTHFNGLTIGPAGLFGSTLLLDENRTLEVDHALALQNAGTLFTANGLHAGSVAIAAGAQVFAGGAMQQVGGGLTNSGHLVLTDATAVDGPVTNAAGGAITALEDVTFDDLVQGAGGFFGPGAITFAGGFSPGASPGEATFEGNVTLVGSNALFLEIGGTEPGDEYDALTIDGSAALGGDLELTLIGGISPAVGDAFSILTAAGGVSGQFTTLAAELPVLAGGKHWLIDYNPTSVVLEVLPAFEADFDEDGDVDGADLAKWQSGFGTVAGATHMQGDADGDLDVDGADFLVWQRQLGSTSAQPGSASAPEPAAWLLGCLACAAVARLRRNLRGLANAI